MSKPAESAGEPVAEGRRADRHPGDVPALARVMHLEVIDVVEELALLTDDLVVQDVPRTRDRAACRYCGATTELQFDHIIPVAMGGSTAPENLRVLCGPCNRQKGPSITLHR